MTFKFANMKISTLSRIVLIITLLINVSTISAQWSLQTNPLGSGESAMVGKVQFLSATEGWINATAGSLLHTTDGGTNWTVVTPFPSDTVSSISDPAFNMQFIDANTGWVMKTIGNLELSENGNFVYYPAKGAVVYYTTNGGTTWNKSVIATGTGVVGAQLQFLDASNGYASVFNVILGEGSLYKTTNGGVSWTQVGTAIAASDEVQLFYFPSVSTGWFLTINDRPAKFNINKTTDGGLTWLPQYKDSVSHGADTLQSCGDIKFIDANNGWAVGPNSRIVKTTNGGITWTQVSSELTAGQNAYQKYVYMLDANHVWVSADNADVYGSSNNHFVMHTTDGGNSWVKDDISLSNSVFCIYFRDVNTGWLTSDYGVIAKYGSPNAILNPVDNSLKIAVNGNTIELSGCIPGENIQLYNISGKRIKNLTIENSSISIPDISAGFYLIKSGKSCSKVVVE